MPNFTNEKKLFQNLSVSTHTRLKYGCRLHNADKEIAKRKKCSFSPIGCAVSKLIDFIWIFRRNPFAWYLCFAYTTYFSRNFILFFLLLLLMFVTDKQTKFVQCWTHAQSSRDKSNFDWKKELRKIGSIELLAFFPWLSLSYTNRARSTNTKKTFLLFVFLFHFGAEWVVYFW